MTWFDTPLNSEHYSLVRDMTPREVIRNLALRYTKAPEVAAKDEVVARMWMALIEGMGRVGRTRREFFVLSFEELKDVPVAKKMLDDLLLATIKDMIHNGAQSQDDADFMLTMTALLAEQGVDIA